jgi:hypothetical protein
MPKIKEFKSGRRKFYLGEEVYTREWYGGGIPTVPVGWTISRIFKNSIWVEPKEGEVRFYGNVYFRRIVERKDFHKTYFRDRRQEVVELFI